MAQATFTPQRTMWSKTFTYDVWMESTGIPIHTGFFIDDLRTVELGWWEERQCLSAFIQLLGQEGVSSTRITEIPAGESTHPLKFALHEVVLAGATLSVRVEPNWNRAIANGVEVKAPGKLGRGARSHRVEFGLQ